MLKLKSNSEGFSLPDFKIPDKFNNLTWSAENFNQTLTIICKHHGFCSITKSFHIKITEFEIM
ncbi:hypothetical protein QR98_0045500 [Sarcoptes scabiei]|uniref:Uncharacterized protein n=1 Tax=Sarcoptes scabiei TaxID=52283 RepID=A0A132A561_SARSC|nr:hypothetical protein QR98_0045500 [Sarcoptes scabiei]